MKTRILLLSLCLLLALSACGGGKDDGPSKVSPGEDNSSGKPAQTNFVVGDTIKVQDLEFTVLGTRTAGGSDFLKPAEGNTFFLIDIAVANKSDKAASISTLAMFDLRDSEGRSASVSISAQSAGKSSLDGTVLPGKVLRGELGYEIPADATGYELQINPSVFGSKSLFSVDLDTVSETPGGADAIVSAKSGDEIAIGTAYETGDFEIVVHGVRTSGGQSFMAPSQGNTFLLVDVSLTNKGTEAKTISSMLMFELHDMQGYKYNISISAVSAGQGGLDGQVMGGKTLRGELGYEVPADATGLELYINPGVFGSDQLFVVALD